jgi:hypothetical protein
METKGLMLTRFQGTHYIQKTFWTPEALQKAGNFFEKTCQYHETNSWNREEDPYGEQITSLAWEPLEDGYIRVTLPNDSSGQDVGSRLLNKLAHQMSTRTGIPVEGLYQALPETDVSAVSEACTLLEMAERTYQHFGDALRRKLKPVESMYAAAFGRPQDG